MIEILCADTNAEVRLERRPEALPRVILALHHSAEDAVQALGGQLTNAEANALRRLWADDGTHRVYTHTPDGVLFRFATD